MNVSAGNGFLGLYYKKVTISRVSILKGYGDMGVFLTHCGRVTQICVFNTVKLGTSASSP